jgi:hypothetical protein
LRLPLVPSRVAHELDGGATRRERMAVGLDRQLVLLTFERHLQRVQGTMDGLDVNFLDSSSAALGTELVR